MFPCKTVTRFHVIPAAHLQLQQVLGSKTNCRGDLQRAGGCAVTVQIAQPLSLPPSTSRHCNKKARETGRKSGGVVDLGVLKMAEGVVRKLRSTGVRLDLRSRDTNLHVPLFVLLIARYRCSQRRRNERLYAGTMSCPALPVTRRGDAHAAPRREATRTSCLANICGA